MSLVDKLLKIDIADVTEMPTGEIEIKRLSEKIGEPFIVQCRAINGKRLGDFRKMSIDYGKKGQLKEVDTTKIKELTLLNGIVEPNLKDDKLKTHFGVVTPDDLLYKLFLAGEIDDIYELIQNLSGYEDDEEEGVSVEEEIKN